MTTKAQMMGLSRSEEVVRKHKEFLWPAVTNYYAKPLVADYGQMQYLWDLDGRKYLDFFGGILTISVGHTNPKVISKIKAQTEKLQHTSTLYPNEQIVALAESWRRSRRGNCRRAFSPIRARKRMKRLFCWHEWRRTATT